MLRRVTSTDQPRKPSGAALPQAHVTDAIRRATLDELAEHGYGRTSVEAVARRAGVGKAAVYRRFPSKLSLVVGVVSETAVRPEDIPDTGSLVADVRAFLDAAHELLLHPLGSRIIPDLVSEAIRIPELGAVLEQAVGVPRRRLCRQILHRAVERGELPDNLDHELALDLIPAGLYWRISVRRARITDAERGRLAGAVVAGLRAL